jgi:hypothetical protein
MPVGAEILPFVRVEGRDVFIYAIVDPDSEKREKRYISVVGTGIPFLLSVNSRYIGSFVVSIFAGHVFEVRN